MSKSRGNKINDKSKKFKMLFIIFLCISIVMVILSSLGFLNWLTIFPITVDAKRRRLQKKIQNKIKDLVKDIEISKDDIKSKKTIVECITDNDKREKVQRLQHLSSILNEIILNNGDDNFSNLLKKVEELIDNDEDINNAMKNRNSAFYIKNMMKVK